jgi:uncharacterized protein DUF2798
MPKLPRHFAPFIFGIIQAALTTGIATAIATPLEAGFDWEYCRRWLTAWAVAWLTMLPVVIFFAPVIRRTVEALTAQVDEIK